jgi:hypothetical protein
MSSLFSYVPLQSVPFLKLIVALMNPFDIQMHVSWYHAIDTKHVHILVKFERSLSLNISKFFNFRSNSKKFKTRRKVIQWGPKCEPWACYNTKAG